MSENVGNPWEGLGGSVIIIGMLIFLVLFLCHEHGLLEWIPHTCIKYNGGG